MQNSPSIGKIALVGPCGRRAGNLKPVTLQLARALRQLYPATQVLLVDTTGPPEQGGLPCPARSALVAGREESYFAAAHHLNKPDLGVDVVVLQSSADFGEGKDGARIQELLAALTIPVVMILPQLDRRPSQGLCETLKVLAGLSDRIVVKNQADRALLEDRCGTAASHIDVIPHPTIRGTLQDEVSVVMNDEPEWQGDAEAPARSRDRPPAGKRTWPTVAESYNRSFMQAINEALPVRETNRIPPGPGFAVTTTA